jgi:hypothetical protein
MSKKTPVQNLPHHGVKSKMIRVGHIVKQEGEDDRVFTTIRKTFMPKGVEAMPAGSPSISRAKRFMRTGSAG